MYHNGDSFAGYIPSFLASNVKVMDWLPQNDLLGHKDIKAFVSHVGHNSLYETAYHGVPVVGFPLFAEQHSNARKAEHFGFGSAVDHKTTDAQQLYKVIEFVISEPRYFLPLLLRSLYNQYAWARGFLPESHQGGISARSS